MKNERTHKQLLLSGIIIGSLLIICGGGNPAKQEVALFDKETDNNFPLKETMRGFDSGWVYFASDTVTGPIITGMDSAKVTQGKLELYGMIADPEVRWIGTDIGQWAPEFSIPDKNGKEISLNSYQGKWLLVDFWASWCHPCRAENPNLLTAYASFNQKGFEILGVSMDGSRKSWLKAVQQDGLPWIQVSDLKASKSELKGLYGIRAIPMNFLLDKEGRIIARNLRGEALQKKLAELIY